MTIEALGMIETRGLIAAIEGSDAMLKAANVRLSGYLPVGSGLVSAFVKGELGAVKAAVEAGAGAASRVGEVLSTHVISHPHPDLKFLIPQEKR